MYSAMLVDKVWGQIGGLYSKGPGDQHVCFPELVRNVILNSSPGRMTRMHFNKTPR